MVSTVVSTLLIAGCSMVEEAEAILVIRDAAVVLVAVVDAVAPLTHMLLMALMSLIPLITLPLKNGRLWVIPMPWLYTCITMQMAGVVDKILMVMEEVVQMMTAILLLWTLLSHRHLMPPCLL